MGCGGGGVPSRSKTPGVPMDYGQKVRMRAYGGEELERLVIQEGDDFVVVCREQEFQAAEREGRRPEGVGVLKRFIIGGKSAATPLRSR